MTETREKTNAQLKEAIETDVDAAPNEDLLVEAQHRETYEEREAETDADSALEDNAESLELQEEESEVEIAEEVLAPQTFSAKVIYALKKIAHILHDLYDENFGGAAKRYAEEEAAKKGPKVDQSISGLKAAQKKRMSRAVGTITSKPISSTRGNPTRQKTVVVKSKTYKPNLERF